MKKISIILAGIQKTCIALAIVSFSFGISSCQDWLEMPDLTAEDSDFVFENEYKADMFVQGCYRGLIHSEMFYQLGMGETVMHASEDGTTNNSKYMICNYKYDPTMPATVTTIFKEQYRIIESTNIGISQLSNMPETSKRNE